ncbi:MAG: kelch repeat-containing protein [Microscillaceae bacterium]|nr:kelch repeat-containing protein [Microscillaceae bacterium]
MLNKSFFFKKITVGIILLWQCIFLQQAAAQSSTGQWFVQSTNGISPENRHEGSFVEVGGKFYLIGGRGTKKIQAYNPVTKTWSNTNTSTSDIHHFQPVAYKSKIYIIGAFNGGYPNENPVANVLIYDTQTDQLTTGPAIPSNRLRGSAGVVLYEGKFYIISGNRKGHRAFTDNGEAAHVTWFDSFDPETNAWQVLPNAPNARDHFHAAVIGTKMYVAGGRRSSFDMPIGTFADTEDDVDVFDFKAGTWLSGNALPGDLPTERAGASVAALGTELIVIGGETENNNTVSLPKTEILDTYTGTWRTLANMNTGRHATQAIVYQGDVFLAAGSKTKGGTEITAGENFLEAFSFDGAPGTTPYNFWTNIGNSSKPRSESQCIVYENEVYLFNGFGPNIKIENSCEKYNPYTNRWTTLKPMPNQPNGSPWAVTHNGIALVSDTIWIVGGRIGDPGTVTNKVWWYVISQNNWYEGPSLPFAAGGGGLGRLGRKLHYVGGFDANAQCDVNVHLFYDLDKPSLGWQNITSTAGMPDARNHFGTVVLDGKLYTIGGQHGHDAGCVGLANPAADVNDVHVYDPATNQWTRLANFPHNESHIEPSTFTIDGKIYVVGGQSLGNEINVYDPIANTWTEQTNHLLQLNLLAPGARIFDQTLVIMTGGAPNTTFPTSVTRVKTFPRTPVNQLSFNPKTLQVSLSGTQTQKIKVILSSTNDAVCYTLNTSSLPSWLSLNKSEGEAYASFEEIELTFNGTPVGPGTYTFSLIASAPGYTNATLNLTLIKDGGSTGLDLAVNELALINAANAQKIRTLNTGSDVLVLSQLPATLSIEALVGNSAKSVEFQVNGGTPRVENVAPYSLAGDQTSSFTPYPFTPGSYTIKVTAFSGINKTGTAGTPYTLNLTVQNTPPPSSGTIVTEFVLVNASNAQAIRTLNPVNDVIVLDQLPAGLSIEAKTGNQVGSVEFQVNQNAPRTESIAPYSLAGDQTTSFTPYPFAPGTYMIKATPYSGPGKTGTTGATFTLNLTVQATSGVPTMSLSMVNATTDQIFLAPIPANAQINAGQISTFNIIAQNFPAETKSIVFEITQGTSLGFKQTESMAPYALFGDVNGNYNPRTVQAGDSYTVSAKAYSQVSGGGTLLQQTSASFTFTNNQAFSMGSQVNAKTFPTKIISIYPNTIGDAEDLHLLIDNSLESKISYELFDQYGRSIVRKEKIIHSDSQDIVLDIQTSDLKPGLYFLSLSSDLIEQKIIRLMKR